MREPLTLAVAQPPCMSYDIARNAKAHADAVRAAGARVVIFPELSLTGYELEADPITADDPLLDPLVAACAETGAWALVGAPVHGEGGAAHIATLAVDGSGATVAYRKMWLGETESAYFVPGDKPAVHEVDGWRLGLAICKDTGIPQHAAETAALGIDAYLTGSVKSTGESALQDERACRIATEHGVWVAVASFAGSTGGGFAEAAGRSGIWRPGGAVVTQAGPETGAVARATLT
ncbi:carbon-nitrogen hydrolase family protein [Streptomyces sp. NPDC048639]|uniref:carbon-nitrogen hydrolase family protein n=1 Tax=Streptomyces sp. NPDC048639 TaxID=3365581 RepID=UPI00371EEB5F